MKKIKIKNIESMKICDLMRLARKLGLPTRLLLEDSLGVVNDFPDGQAQRNADVA